jgi:hypothetical protein
MVDARAQEKLVEIAMLGDAAWFQDNPDRRMRIRNAVPMEFNGDLGAPPTGMAWRTLVAEAQPGARLRQPIALAAAAEVAAMGDNELFALFMKVATPDVLYALKRLRAAKLPDDPKPLAR